MNKRKGSEMIYTKMLNKSRKVNKLMLEYIIILSATLFPLFVVIIPILNVFVGNTDPQQWPLIYKVT